MPKWTTSPYYVFFHVCGALWQWTRNQMSQKSGHMKLQWFFIVFFSYLNVTELFWIRWALQLNLIKSRKLANNIALFAACSYFLHWWTLNLFLFVFVFFFMHTLTTNCNTRVTIADSCIFLLFKKWNWFWIQCMCTHIDAVWRLQIATNLLEYSKSFFYLSHSKNLKKKKNNLLSRKAANIYNSQWLWCNHFDVNNENKLHYFPMFLNAGRKTSTNEKNRFVYIIICSCFFKHNISFSLKID